jgi:methyl-accepting chemotaxis protein
MKWFINLSTRAKLVLGFGSMWLLLAVVILTAWWSITGITQSEKNQHEVQFEVALKAAQLRSDQHYIRHQMLEMSLRTNRSGQEAIEKNVNERARQIDETVESLLRLDPDPQSQSRLGEYKNTLTAYRQGQEQSIALIHEGKIEEARQLVIGVQDERFEKMRLICAELGTIARERVDKQVAQDQQAARSSILLFVIIGVIASVLGLGMVAILNQTIAKPLGSIAAVAEGIAGGDLSVEVSAGERADEVGTLARTFEQMVKGLRRSTADISEAVNLLSSSASEILAATTQVASSTAETAAAISETTTTVEEVRQAAQLSSEKAQNVAGSAKRVSQASQTGQKSIEETVAGMRHIRDQMESIARTIVRLSKQSQSIGGIIASVADLADQSNLLAVNAAIEAARAGEQGKGFAVVAQEIRSLAEQSKQATAQVRSILSDVQKATSAAVMATEQGGKAVETGVKQSAQTGEAIRVLGKSVEEAVQAATLIVASSQQQVVGMDQIGVAMENINQAGAETAASMRQSETAAKNLHELGQKLKQLVEQYKV